MVEMESLTQAAAVVVVAMFLLELTVVKAAAVL